MELSGGSPVLQLCSVAQVACLEIETNILRHLAVILKYHFEGLKMACMSSDMSIVMLLHDLMPQISLWKHRSCL
jgi:hypothetical protein